VATSFQSVSGAGARGMEELISNTKTLLRNGKKFKNMVFEREIAFNVIPKIGDITANLYSEEEMKLHNESRKILSDNKINLTATTVRVPVLRSHSISLNIEFKNKVSIGNAINALKKFPGLKVMGSQNDSYPTPIDATNRDNCIVGRIRSDFTVKNGISLWIVGDQIRKGAALNAVQIAELL
jgi:aspartate-semialdehyde dehydrogenase